MAVPPQHSPLDDDLTLSQPVLHRHLQITLLANTGVFLIGLMGIAGVILDLPVLYDWTQDGLAMNIQSMMGMLILSLAYFFHTVPALCRQRFCRGLATGCYLAVILIGLIEAVTFLVISQYLSIEAFLVLDEPLLGRITFYTSLGLVLAGSGGLVYLYLSEQSPPWIPRTVQMVSTVLITTAMFGMMQNLAFVPLFRFFISLSSSVGLFLFGIVLLYYPHPHSLLTRSFFSTLINQAYALGILTLWLGAILWLSVLTNTYLPRLDVEEEVATHLVAFSELVEILITSAILGLGLLILGTLDRNAVLTQRLQASFDSYAMLAATLSHDLKAPIQSQTDAVQMVKSGHFGERISDEQNQHILNLVLENNQYEMELVQNLVEMLRYEIHEERYSPQPLELNSLLYQIKAELTPIVLRKGHRLFIHPAPEDRQELLADSLGLKRVLHNLINNALGHVGHDGLVEVKVEPRDIDYLFSVRDNGPGIPQQAQEQLFSYRPPGRQTKTLSTTGLGLYIARRIVQRHGGNIWVESAPGAGATFYFTLPRQAAS